MKSLLSHLYSLLTMPTALFTAVLLLLASCHSHKEMTTTSAEVVDIEAAGSITTSTAVRYQWLSRLSLDIDSFEIEIPTSLPLDTLAGLPQQFAASQPRVRSVVLRGKHASIGKADIVQRNSASIAEQVDTLSAHRSMDKSDHYARDNAGIAKPPDTSKWLLVAALVAIVAALLWLKSKYDK